jgi:hypothetical protein
LTRNAAGVPTALMTRPATAGPVIRARLKAALFSAMAFAIPSRPTISATKRLAGGTVHHRHHAQREREQVHLPDGHRAGQREHAQ